MFTSLTFSLCSAIMKPVNLTKNDEAYRHFLKLVQKIKKKEVFLDVGLTVKELEACIKHAYKSLSKQRLESYNSYVQTMKSKIYNDIEKMRRLGEESIEAPDNSEKTEELNSFVETIRNLTDRGFESVIKKPELIAQQLFSANKAEKGITFVKKYIKNNLNKIKEGLNTRSRQENDNKSDGCSLANAVVEDIAEGLEDDIGGKNDSGISNGNTSLENKEVNSDDNQLSITEQNKTEISRNVSSSVSADYNSINSSCLSAQVSSINTQATNCNNNDLNTLDKISSKLSSSRTKRCLSSNDNDYNGKSTEYSTINKQDEMNDSRNPTFHSRKRFKSISTPANLEDNSFGGSGHRITFSKRFINTITITEIYDKRIQRTSNNPDHTEKSDFLNVNEETAFKNMQSNSDVGESNKSSSSAYSFKTAGTHFLSKESSSSYDDLSHTYNSHDYNDDYNKKI